MVISSEVLKFSFFLNTFWRGRRVLGLGKYHILNTVSHPHKVSFASFVHEVPVGGGNYHNLF